MTTSECHVTQLIRRLQLNNCNFRQMDGCQKCASKAETNPNQESIHTISYYFFTFCTYWICAVDSFLTRLLSWQPVQCEMKKKKNETQTHSALKRRYISAASSFSYSLPCGAAAVRPAGGAARCSHSVWRSAAPPFNDFIAGRKLDGSW